MVSKKANPEPAAKPQPVSLHPLSFEQALKALTATPPMGDKPTRQPKPRAAKRPKRKKKA
jgi:hypothetical protein